MENHNYENEGQCQRKMTSRHLFMLSLGGVIGTGLSENCHNCHNCHTVTLSG